MMRLAALATIIALASCATTTKPQTDPQRADQYARELSGGETLGCSKAAPGKEAEANPGCIYSAAYSGCLEGLTGKQAGPLPASEEFKAEPKLVRIHDKAVKDCTNRP